MEIIGMLSLILGIIGLLSSPWYIGIIPCIIALVLGIVGLSDYLSEKWPAVAGVLSSILGIVIFSYVLVSDLDANRLIIFYAKGDKVYLSNYDDIVDALDELSDDMNQIAVSLETLDDTEYDALSTERVNSTEGIMSVDSVQAPASTDSGMQTILPVETEEAADNSVPNTVPIEIPEVQNIEQSVTQIDNNSIEVHITRTGEKYHSAGCQYLRESDIIVTLEQAKSRGYGPCSKCNPPQ